MGEAMVNLAREALRGEVEVDDTWVGGTQAGLRRSRLLKGRRAALVLVAVERRGRATGRARMVVVPDFRSTTLMEHFLDSRNYCRFARPPRAAARFELRLLCLFRSYHSRQ